jgi:hypothetical protein
MLWRQQCARLLTHPVLLLLLLLLLLQLPLMLCCCCQLNWDAVVWLALVTDLLDVCQGAVAVYLQQVNCLLTNLDDETADHAAQPDVKIAVRL